MWFLGPVLSTGRLVLPADGPVSWTAHADLADVAAAVLADEGAFDGPTPPLTAPHALTFDDIAAIASEAAGPTTTRTTVSDDRFREQMAGQGVPADAVDGLLSIFAAARAGEFAAVDPTLATLIGREPVAMGALLRERLSGG